MRRVVLPSRLGLLMRLRLLALALVLCAATVSLAADTPSTFYSRSPGNSTGKTVVMKTGSLTTTAVTADQVVLTYTVTSGKTFYLTYVVLQTRLTAVSATGAILGAPSLELPSGTKVITLTATNPTTEMTLPYVVQFGEPIPVASATVVRVVTTPAATTSTLWLASFGGYEK